MATSVDEFSILAVKINLRYPVYELVLTFSPAILLILASLIFSHFCGRDIWMSQIHDGGISTACVPEATWGFTRNG